MTCYCKPDECWKLKDECKRIFKDDAGNIIGFIPPPGLHMCPDCHQEFRGPDDRFCPHCHKRDHERTSPFQVRGEP